jgi:hypothetical protein
MNATHDWRGQWLSLHDLSVIMGKSYPMICKMLREGTLQSPGMQPIRKGRRVLVRVEAHVYESLTRV